MTYDADVIPFLGIPLGMTSKDVFEFFTKFGPVEFAKVYLGKEGNYCFAFVTFESRESRGAALEAGEVELTLGNGSRLKVGAARFRNREQQSRTWVRSKRDSPHGPPLQHQDGGLQLHQYHLAPTDLQVNLASLQPGISPLAPHPQYLLINNNFSEEQMFFNHVAYVQPTTATYNQGIFNSIAYNSMDYNLPSDQQNQMFNSVIYKNPTAPEVFNSLVTNPVFYYHPTAGMMPPQYQQQQFPQSEVEIPGKHA